MLDSCLVDVKKYIVVILIIAAFGFPKIIKASGKYNLVPDRKIKNVIIFIGDGMGSAHVTISKFNSLGPEGRLEIEKMPVTGLVNTYSADNWVTDSAGGATALSTGYKTKNSMDSVTPDSIPKQTIFEAARNQRRMVTGLVSTSSITDATPACFVAHSVNRNLHEDIAQQIINSGTNIIMGGGRKYFYPANINGGVRADNKNLIDSAFAKGYVFVHDSLSLSKVYDGKVIGLFNDDGLQTHYPEPSLALMTKKAIDILSKNDNGFMLMVEGSQIDWAGHANNLNEMIRQTLLFDNAVKEGLTYAVQNGNTLVIVTADHETGGITLTSKDRADEKSFGVKWSTDGHTGIPVPIYAYGPHALKFTGILDNTDIPKIISSLLEIELSNRNNESIISTKTTGSK